MRRGVGQIQEVRIGPAAELVDVMHGVIRERVSHVELFALWLVWLVVPCEIAAWVDTPIIACAADKAEVFFEAAVGRPMRAFFADVPFAGHRSAVARGPQRFGDRYAAVVEVALIRRDLAMVDHVADAGLVTVEAG